MLLPSLPLAWTTPWVPALGIDLAWRLDGLAALMLLLILGIGVAVFTYAIGYLRGHPHLGRLLFLLTLFLLSMVGAVLADDLIVLFVFWELTSILSFLLVGFDHADATSRQAALTALVVTGVGGILLLAGCLMLVQAAGTSSITGIIGVAPGMAGSPLLVGAVSLIAIGCFTKSAQVPFHFWLPGAMAAPAPVSAYLHSATMVKLGVYLLARLDAGFGHWPLWQVALSTVGGFTALWGMLLALSEHDLKRILAWSTVSALGTMVMLVGAPGTYAPLGLAAFILAHALYKAPLFFIVGNVEKATGGRNASELCDLRRGMPLNAIAAFLAAIGMAGLPLSLGFVAKAIVKDLPSEGTVTRLLQAGSLVASAVTVALAGVICIRIFWRRGDPSAPVAREGGLALTLPPLLLAVLGFVIGAAPSLVSPILVGAASAIRPGAIDAGMDLPTTGGTISVTVLLGLVLYVFWDPVHAALGRVVRWMHPALAGTLFSRGAMAIVQSGARLTALVQGGRLSRYVLLLFLALAVSLWFLLAAAPKPVAGPPSPAPGFAVYGALFFTAVGALITAGVAHRGLQLVASGIVTTATAFLLLFIGAPDLAMTQFAVETVFVILAATLLLRLVRQGRIRGLVEPRVRLLALLVSLAFGGAIAILVLRVTSAPFDPALARFYGEASVPLGFGRNVVNVILVDFRAFDTLGEAAVVALALFATLPLLQSLRKSGERLPGAPPPRASILLARSAQPLSTALLVASVWILLRGHNEPGGGFVAGLMAVLATVVRALGSGSDAARKGLPFRSPLRLAALGALLSIASGLPALWFGRPFLDHLVTTLPNGFKLSTFLPFDIGIYLAVWGALAGFTLKLLALDPPEHAP